jgi:hypothetical protein
MNDDSISELFQKVSGQAELRHIMSELAAEGLIEVVGYRSNGTPAYRITEKGRQWIAGLSDAAD